MKKYNVTVNGIVYEVEVEEVEVGAEASAPIPAAPKAEAPKAAPKAAPKPAPKASGSVGATKIEAPMPGTVTKVFVKVGDAVKAGDNLIAFEAMKMEQEIKAPKDGVIASVNTEQGKAITTGELIVSLN